jgi:hypothetical protein
MYTRPHSEHSDMAFRSLCISDYVI